MSGQPPPHKDDDHSDNYSPPGRAASNITPQTEQERRDMIRNMLQRAGNALDQVSHQPGMPERHRYPSHEAWLRALLTTSLQQSTDVTDFFGHGNNAGDDTTDNNDDNDNGAGNGSSSSSPPDQGESKDATSWIGFLPQADPLPTFSLSITSGMLIAFILQTLLNRPLWKLLWHVLLLVSGVTHGMASNAATRKSKMV